MRLMPMIFTCPFCNKEKLTSITEDKYIEVKNKEKSIQEIFPTNIFPPSYREIFISHICNSCWEKTFNPGGEEEGSKDCDILADSKDSDIQQLEDDINIMYEQYSRQ